MNFYHYKNLQESIDGMKKIFSISWSLNSEKIAVAHVDDKRSIRISLFNEKGEKKDSFPTRPANKNNKSYVVRDISFSPEGNKIAVSQSDSIVFVYNIGNNWGDKKNICNKFEQTSQVTSLIWPNNKNNELFFGVAEGKIKQGNLKTNLAQVLYSTESYVVSLDCSINGKSIISGHIDCSIYKYNLEKNSLERLITSSCIPYCLGYANDILVAGNDCIVNFYNEDTGVKLNANEENNLDSKIINNNYFNYTNFKSIKEFSCCKVNNTGDAIALGNYNRFIIFYRRDNGIWEEVFNCYIENFYTITALAWKSDGSSLITGNLCGSIDIFESCIRKSLYENVIEISVISDHHLLFKHLYPKKLEAKLNFYNNLPEYSIDTIINNYPNSFDNEYTTNTNNTPRINIKLKNNNSLTSIEKMTIIKENYIIILTKTCLILANLTLEKCSELNNFRSFIDKKYNQETSILGSGIDRYNFDSNIEVCLLSIYNNVYFIQYGVNEIVGSYNLDNICLDLISVKLLYYNNLYYATKSNNKINLNNKETSMLSIKARRILAYLHTPKTLNIVEFNNNEILFTYTHNIDINYTSLNFSCTKLIFLDINKQAYYINIKDHINYKSNNTTINTNANLISQNTEYIQFLNYIDVIICKEKYILKLYYFVHDYTFYKDYNIKSYIINNSDNISLGVNYNDLECNSILKNIVEQDNNVEIYLDIYFKDNNNINTHDQNLPFININIDNELIYLIKLIEKYEYLNSKIKSHNNNNNNISPLVIKNNEVIIKNILKTLDKLTKKSLTNNISNCINNKNINNFSIYNTIKEENFNKNKSLTNTSFYKKNEYSNFCNIINNEYIPLWQYLCKVSLEDKFLKIAESCYGILGKLHKVKFLKEIENDISKFSINHPIVEAKIFILNYDFNKAENILLSNNLTREAYDIFTENYRYEQAYNIALRYKFNDLEEIKRKYLNILLNKTKDHNKAGVFMFQNFNSDNIKENISNKLKALSMLIDNGSYTTSINLIKDYLDENKNDSNIIKLIKQTLDPLIVKLKDELVKNKLNNKLALLEDFYFDNKDNCLNYYIIDNNFPKAKEISVKLLNECFNDNITKSKYNNLCTEIEYKWGCYLYNKKEYNIALPHFKECNNVYYIIKCYINLKLYNCIFDLIGKLLKSNNDNNNTTEVIRVLCNDLKDKKEILLFEFYCVLIKDYYKIIDFYISSINNNKYNLINNNCLIKNKYDMITIKFIAFVSKLNYLSNNVIDKYYKQEFLKFKEDLNNLLQSNMFSIFNEFVVSFKEYSKNNYNNIENIEIINKVLLYLGEHKLIISMYVNFLKQRISSNACFLDNNIAKFIGYFYVVLHNLECNIQKTLIYNYYFNIENAKEEIGNFLLYFYKNIKSNKFFKNLLDNVIKTLELCKINLTIANIHIDNNDFENAVMFLSKEKDYIDLIEKDKEKVENSDVKQYNTLNYMIIKKKQIIINTANDVLKTYIKINNSNNLPIEENNDNIKLIELFVNNNMLEIILKVLCDNNYFKLADYVLKLDKTLKLKNINEFNIYLNYKKALMFKQKGEIEKAEKYFILSNKFKEAVSMYVELEDYEKALSIIKKKEYNLINVYDKITYTNLLNNVYLSKGYYFSRLKDFKAAESNFLLAKAPEKMYNLYIKKNMTDNAKTFGSIYCPDLLKNHTNNNTDDILNFNNLNVNKVVHNLEDIPIKDNNHYNNITSEYLNLEDNQCIIIKLESNLYDDNCTEKSKYNNSFDNTKYIVKNNSNNSIINNTNYLDNKLDNYNYESIFKNSYIINTLNLKLDDNNYNKIIKIAGRLKKESKLVESIEVLLSIQDYQFRKKLNIIDNETILNILNECQNILKEYVNTNHLSNAKLKTSYFNNDKHCQKDKRLNFILQEIATRYINLNSHLEACKTYMIINKFEYAFMCLIKGNLFTEAKELVDYYFTNKNLYNSDLNKEKYEKIILKKQIEYVPTDIQQMIDAGDFTEVMYFLNNFISQKKDDNKIYQNYFYSILSILFNNKKYCGACEFILICYNVNKDNISSKIKLKEVIVSLSYEILAEDVFNELELLKFIFTKYKDHLIDKDNVKSIEDTNEIDKNQINRFLNASHFQFIKYLISPYKEKFSFVYYKANLTLLRFCNIVRTDIVILDLYRECKSKVRIDY